MRKVCEWRCDCSFSLGSLSVGIFAFARTTKNEKRLVENDAATQLLENKAKLRLNALLENGHCPGVIEGTDKERGSTIFKSVEKMNHYVMYLFTVFLLHYLESHKNDA